MYSLDKALVSCIILSYNSGEKLFSTIESACAQSYENIEYIIADDASDMLDEKKIRKILEKRTSDYKIIKNKENIGTVKNYNNAIRESKGKYIMVLSGDDLFYSKDIVSKTVLAFETYDTEIVVAYAIDNNGITQNKKKIEKYLKGSSKKKTLEALYKGNFVSGAVTYFSNSYFMNHGLFDEDIVLIEDWPNIIKAVRENASIYVLSELAVKYSLSGVSSIEDKSNVYLEDYVRVMNKYILNNLDANNFSKRYCKYMVERIVHRKHVPLLTQLQYLDVVLYKVYERILYAK